MSEQQYRLEQQSASTTAQKEIDRLTRALAGAIEERDRVDREIPGIEARLSAKKDYKQKCDDRIRDLNAEIANWKRSL